MKLETRAEPYVLRGRGRWWSAGWHRAGLRVLVAAAQHRLETGKDLESVDGLPLDPWSGKGFELEVSGEMLVIRSKGKAADGKGVKFVLKKKS